ncbi:hypothetical protein CEXT_174871 [Caerostris extrusa]|uniref:Secreted protein n=1 Tax=Caerostris extrusa TaxID=172846 RepID=A0AAV4U347_CAEEX|nr:hypothetical protein CEXT_174871 [Caerostris extrusa]
MKTVTDPSLRIVLICICLMARYCHSPFNSCFVNFKFYPHENRRMLHSPFCYVGGRMKYGILPPRVLFAAERQDKTSHSDNGVLHWEGPVALLPISAKPRNCNGRRRDPGGKRGGKLRISLGHNQFPDLGKLTSLCLCIGASGKRRRRREGKEREEIAFFPSLCFSPFSKILPSAFTLHRDVFDSSGNHREDLEEWNTTMRKTDCSEIFFASVDIQKTQ